MNWAGWKDAVNNGMPLKIVGKSLGMVMVQLLFVIGAAFLVMARCVAKPIAEIVTVKYPFDPSERGRLREKDLMFTVILVATALGSVLCILLLPETWNTVGAIISAAAGGILEYVVLRGSLALEVTIGAYAAPGKAAQERMRTNDILAVGVIVAGAALAGILLFVLKSPWSEVSLCVIGASVTLLEYLLFRGVLWMGIAFNPTQEEVEQSGDAGG